MDIQSSSNGLINGGLSDAWVMTLGASNTLSFVNFDPGQRLTLKLVQDGTGSRTVTWPSTVTWQSGQAPTLQTAANAVDVFVFVNDGTLNSPTFRDVSGSSYRIPARVKDAGLTTIVAAAVTAITLSLTGGNGQGTGNLSSAMLIKAKSGAIVLSAIDGSGGFVTGGSGGLATGLATPGTSGYKTGKFYADPSGNTVAKGTMSGGSLKLNGVGSGGILCGKTDGSIGKCSAAVYGAGKCVCQ